MRPVRVLVEFHLVWGILLRKGKKHVSAEINLWLQLHSSPSINHVDVSAYICFMSSYLSITCESPQCPKVLPTSQCHALLSIHIYILCMDLNILTSWKAICIVHVQTYTGIELIMNSPIRIHSIIANIQANTSPCITQ